MEATNNGQTFLYALPKASKSRMAFECRYNPEEFFKVNPDLRVEGYAVGQCPDSNWLTQQIEEKDRSRSGRYHFLSTAGIHQLACKCVPKVWHKEAGGWGQRPTPDPMVHDAALDALWKTLDDHNGRLINLEAGLVQKVDKADIRKLQDAYADQDLRVDGLVKSNAELRAALETLVRTLEQKHKGLWWRIFGR